MAADWDDRAGQNALIAWLGRYQRPGSPEGPNRGKHLCERLEPGDVWEDGSIGLKTGWRDWDGPVWVGEDQAVCASYYGWQIDPNAKGPVFVEIDGGDKLWRITRSRPCIS